MAREADDENGLERRRAVGTAATRARVGSRRTLRRAPALRATAQAESIVSVGGFGKRCVGRLSESRNPKSTWNNETRRWASATFASNRNCLTATRPRMSQLQTDQPPLTAQRPGRGERRRRKKRRALPEVNGTRVEVEAGSKSRRRWRSRLFKVRAGSKPESGGGSRAFLRLGPGKCRSTGHAAVWWRGNQGKKLRPKPLLRGTWKHPLRCCTTATRCHPHPGSVAAAAAMWSDFGSKPNLEEGKQLTPTTCHLCEIRLLAHIRALCYMQRRVGSFLGDRTAVFPEQSPRQGGGRKERSVVLTLPRLHCQGGCRMRLDLIRVIHQLTPHNAARGFSSVRSTYVDSVQTHCLAGGHHPRTGWMEASLRDIQDRKRACILQADRSGSVQVGVIGVWRRAGAHFLSASRALPHCLPSAPPDPLGIQHRHPTELRSALFSDCTHVRLERTTTGYRACRRKTSWPPA